MSPTNRDIQTSHPDKTFFPKPGYTKADVVDYYRSVAGVMVPHMKRYGLSMQRFPDGIEEQGFYNKDAPDHFPDWITRTHMTKRQGGSYQAPVVDSQAALAYLANQAVLTYHLYLSRTDDLRHPDRMVFDLDPPEKRNDPAAPRQAAKDLREVLADIDLEAWVQTTGSKGFHLIVPIKRNCSFDQVRTFAKNVARLLMRRKPQAYTLQQRKDKRDAKVFLDTLRNAHGATAVAPYSLRPTPDANVATPISWDELDNGASPQDYHLANIPRRLAQKQDPLAGFMQNARAIPTRLDKLDSLLQNHAPATEETSR
jgi:bifunctional non-homologous end joining protein LigD